MATGPSPIRGSCWPTSASRPGLAGGQAPALPGRHHRRRQGRHRRLRRCRRVDGAQQRRRVVPGAAVRASQTSASRQGLARRQAPALPGRHHRRRQGGHRRLRRRRRVDGAQQRRRHLPGCRSSCSADFGFEPGLARGQAPALPGRHHGRRQGRHRRLRRCRRVDGAQQRRRHLPGAAVRARRLRLRGRRLAGGEASALPGRHHRRRQGGHRRLRRCRRVDGAQQRRRHLPGRRSSCSRTSASRPAAGGSRSTRACWPTSPATARQTSSASATRGCSWR